MWKAGTLKKSAPAPDHEIGEFTVMIDKQFSQTDFLLLLLHELVFCYTVLCFRVFPTGPTNTKFIILTRLTSTFIEYHSSSCYPWRPSQLSLYLRRKQFLNVYIGGKGMIYETHYMSCCCLNDKSKIGSFPSSKTESESPSSKKKCNNNTHEQWKFHYSEKFLNTIFFVWNVGHAEWLRHIKFCKRIKEDFLDLLLLVSRNLLPRAQDEPERCLALRCEPCHHHLPLPLDALDVHSSWVRIRST